MRQSLHDGWTPQPQIEEQAMPITYASDYSERIITPDEKIVELTKQRDDARAELATALEEENEMSRDLAGAQVELDQATGELAAERGERDRLDGELGFGIAKIAICLRDLAAVLDDLARISGICDAPEGELVRLMRIKSLADAALDAAKEKSP